MMHGKKTNLNLMVVTSILLITFCLLSATAFANSYEVKYEDYAAKLKDIGVFKGTGAGFELDRKPTRIEAAVMFVRLLGAEKEAIEKKYKHSFNDVPGWANDYVGYLFHEKLTNGISATAFGSADFIQANSYFTFILRALGYNDAAGEFVWNESLEFALNKAFISDMDFNELAADTFLRDHVAKVSYLALKMPMKNNDATLEKKLIDMGVIKADAETAEIEPAYVNWIYFVSEKDNLLYKVDTDGKQKTNLTEKATWFYDMDEEWIYYYGDNGFVCKMKKDGSNKTQINDKESGWINVAGDWIYYSNYGDIDNIYKMKKDGSDNIKLSDGPKAYNLIVAGDWIYYVNWPEHGSLYKMNTDGSNKTKLSDGVCSGVTLDGEWIYTGIKSQGIKNIYKMKTDGSNKTMLTDKDSDILWIQDEWVYYSEQVEKPEDMIEDESEDNAWDSIKSYRMMTDGSNKTLITDDHMKIIHIENDWIYYENRDDDESLCRIKTDGTDRQILE